MRDKELNPQALSIINDIRKTNRTSSYFTSEGKVDKKYTSSENSSVFNNFSKIF